jgi:hypothetical protein
MSTRDVRIAALSNLQELRWIVIAVNIHYLGRVTTEDGGYETLKS